MLHDIGIGLHTQIVEVPRRIGEPSYVLLVFGIADNKTVFLAMRAHPLVHGNFFKASVFGLVIAVGDVAGKAGLMLTGTRGLAKGFGYFLTVLVPFAVIQILSA